jgi:hypothetical protein
MARIGKLKRAASAWLAGTSPGGEVGRASEKSPPFLLVDLAHKETGYIPTPPRTTTKLFDATCVISPAGHLEKTGEGSNARTLADPGHPPSA